jgi:hypothetical protein
MKFIFFTLLLTLSGIASANHCAEYRDRPEYMNALSALSVRQMRPLYEICESSRIMDVEVSPSQVIRSGEVIPQIVIYLHYSEYSCKYLLNRKDLTLTESRCFSTF